MPGGRAYQTSGKVRLRGVHYGKWNDGEFNELVTLILADLIDGMTFDEISQTLKEREFSRVRIGKWRNEVDKALRKALGQYLKMTQ